jgi:hypothetical protein
MRRYDYGESQKQAKKGLAFRRDKHKQEPAPK